ncbi:unnamed protein product, partial [Meganyctiphanes norvegica]
MNTLHIIQLNPPPPPTKNPAGNVGGTVVLLHRQQDEAGQTTTAVPIASAATATQDYYYYCRLHIPNHVEYRFVSTKQVLSFLVLRHHVVLKIQQRTHTDRKYFRDGSSHIIPLTLYVTSIGFAIVLQLSFSSFLHFLVYTICVDTLAAGVLVATFLWIVTNHYLVKPTCRDQDVEWGYAFDVHLNAFFPSLIILHFFQLFFYHIFISQDWFISRLFGNLLWVWAIGYYIYITFLGYSALPILHRTRVFLYGLPLLFVFFVVTLASGWNMVDMLMNFYHNRVL